MYRTGRGPYRNVADQELRPIFHLTPQNGRSFMFHVTTTPPSGTNLPAVTGLLRAMLYVRIDTRAERVALERDIAARLPDRNDIAIRAKLLSLCRQAAEKPWAFPALLDTHTCRRVHAVLKVIVERSDTTGNFGADPVSNGGIAYLFSKLGAASGTFGFGLANYFGGRSKDYYEYYVQRVAIELALRGVTESSL